MADPRGTGAPAAGEPGSAPICRAPFVAMEFDPFGDVQACCANALYPLGNVRRSSLREIWEGPRAEAMRAALRDHDLTLGCSVCRYRLAYGHGELPIQYYDNFPMPEGEPEWPFSLQFSLHNTCNLACVMCGADRSSRIRTQRSHLEPLPHAYGEAFFEEIVPFLAHAGAVDFSGGEPFLVTEHGRIWDLLIDLDSRPLCSLTTNGTIWNARTERVLAELDTHISVSVDGMTRETFEAIRVGADFDVVMANLDRFLAYTRERGTILTMSWSLVRSNWHELAAAARFAEERGIHLKVQTVIEPEFGLQRLPTPELEAVVRALDAETPALLDDLELNADMWRREVGRLHEELENRGRTDLRPRYMEPAGPDNVDHLVAMVLDAEGRRLDEAAMAAARARAEADLRRWCDSDGLAVLELDDAGVVRAGGLAGLLPAPWPEGADRPGTTLGDVLHAVERALGGQVWIGDEWPEADRLVQTIWIGRQVRDKVGVVLKLVDLAGPDGHQVLVAADTTLLPAADAAVPVSLGTRSGTSG